MKKIYFIILFAFTGVIANAQSCWWAKSMGGSQDQSGVSNLVDDSNNVYTTGYFRGTVDFDPGPGVQNLTSPGYITFVSKLNASGNFIWVKLIGRTINGAGQSYAHSMAFDGHGNFYVTGSFQDSCDFDPSSGSYVLPGTVWPGGATYICKLDSAGNFIWAKSIQGPGTAFSQAIDITVDGMGNVYTSGSFHGIVDFDPGVGVHNDTSVAGGNNDIFISKLDSAGNFRWVKQIGGTGNDDGWSITADAIGNVYTTGRFQNTVDFDPGIGISNLTSLGGDDIYITKIDTAGNFRWVKRFGEVNDEMGTSIALDDSNNVYTTGFFHGMIDFNPGAGIDNHASVASEDVFVSKLDSAGNYVWAKSFGGSSDDASQALTIDTYNNVYLTGYYRNTVDFNPGAGSDNHTAAGNTDIFVSKLNSSGNFVWAKSMGGSGDENGTSIAVDTSQNVYTTGTFYAPADFDPYGGVYNLTPNGTNDIFISKINNPLIAAFSSVNNVTCYGGHDGSATVAASGGSLPYSYSWNTIPVQTTATATNLSAGLDIDTVIVTESFGCSAKLVLTVTEPPADFPTICMVTVDSASQHNIIIWDKTSFTDVDSFIVYREISTNNYKRIGAVPFDSLSQFIDTVRTKYAPNTGNPNSGTYRYKLKTRNACGIYSAYSPYHNTIYFLNSGATFFWTQLYTIEAGANPVSTYVLMRDDNSTGNWQPVGSVAGTQQTINDPLYTIYQNTASWRVETQWAISCTPTMRIPNPNQTATNGSSSYSNIVTNNPNAIKNNSLDEELNISPNPSDGKILLNYSSLEKNQKTSVEVYNMIGTKVYSQNDMPINQTTIDLSALPAGVYFLNLKTENNIIVKKIIIE